MGLDWGLMDIDLIDLIDDQGGRVRYEKKWKRC
jgi:hypothetical protein